jgi:Vitamin B6 photo-protection and homoeostasis
MSVSLLFTSQFSYRIDADPKFYRLLADALNDVALSLEVAGPLLWTDARALLAVLCVAGAMKAVVGATAGATRAALTHHFCRQGNQADVAAKEGTQETVVNLVGMLLGAAVVWAWQDSVSVLGTFAALTALHVWANWKAVRCLRVRRLNANRADVARAVVLHSLLAPSVALVNDREPLLPTAFWSADLSSPTTPVLLPLLSLFSPPASSLAFAASDWDETISSSSLPPSFHPILPVPATSPRSPVDWLREHGAVVALTRPTPSTVLVRVFFAASHAPSALPPLLALRAYLVAAIARDAGLQRLRDDPQSVALDAERVVRAVQAAGDWDTSLTAAFPDLGWRIDPHPPSSSTDTRSPTPRRRRRS